MRAAVYYGQKDVRIEDLETPRAGDHDIVIRNLYASICGTDVAVYMHGPNTGHRITVGSEFGHEMVSEVVQVGKNVERIQVGDLVYPYPRLAKGDPRRAGTVGGFSEYVLIPNAELGQQVYAVPAQIPVRTACLIEPFTVGCRAARRGMIPNGDKKYQTGQSAVVFGCGTIGIAAAVAFQYFGMDKVMICDFSDYRLHLAENLGFETCNPGRESFVSHAKTFFGTAPSLTGETADIDCWLDAAGAESILEDFFRYGKIESRFVSVAVNNVPRKLDLLHMTYAQQSLIGSGGYMPEDVWDVQKIMTCGRWNLETVITREFSLDELETAIRTAADVDAAGNVVIKMNQ